MSGRVTDVEGIPFPSKTFYVATATGGIWKTTNAGTTFRPVFTNERVISLGDIAIAPSDTNIIWAGTGDFLVTITVEGTTMSQVLRVEQLPAGGGGSPSRN